MRTTMLICCLLILVSMPLAAQIPEYTGLERPGSKAWQRAEHMPDGRELPQISRADRGAWQLAYRLFDAQWPEHKAPGAEWNLTASNQKWIELTCLYFPRTGSDFGRTKCKAQTIRVYLDAAGQAERAEFRQIPPKELRALENFYSGVR